MPPIERALLRTVPWLVAGLVMSIPLLLVDVSDEPIGWFIAQLSVLVALGIALTVSLMTYGDEPWFITTSWSPAIRETASGVGLVVLVTGTVGLVTLASSAALRFDPSTQFLQLISALDIAWAGAALIIGVHRAAARGWEILAGVSLGIICVWSIWSYLSAVGFGPDGAWIVSAPDLMRYVLPFDVVAAVMAVIAFLFGVRARLHATEQPSPQS